MADRNRAAEDKDPELRALQGVHAALKGLPPEGRRKVLVSVSALLEIPESHVSPETRIAQALSQATTQKQESVTRGVAPRPLSIRELMQEKRPGTNMEKIVLFAYYREKYEGTSRFSRRNLETYFAKARENPPKNFDRDFNNTVLRGWIHEDREDSYITSKGIESVESGFPNKRNQGNSGRKPRKRGQRRTIKK